MSNNFHESHWGQCLELLSHLCQYSEDILLVTGPSGVGKTTMRYELIRAESVNFVLRDLIATVDLTPEDISAQVEFVDDNPEKPDTLLLIDDAQNLSLDAITMLLQLKQRTSKPLHIVLFANEELGKKISRSVLKEDFFEQVHTIEIEPLTIMELEAFLMHQLRDTHNSNDLPFNKSKYKKIYAASGGIPGKALQMAKNLLAGKSAADHTSQRLSPFAVGVTVSFGILFCILAFMWPAAEQPAITTVNARLPEIATEVVAIEPQDSVTQPTIEVEPTPTPDPTPLPQDPDPQPVPVPEPDVTPQPELVSTTKSEAVSKISDDEKIARLEKKLQALQNQLNNEQSARKASELKLQQVNKKSVEKTASKSKTLSFSKYESLILNFPNQNFTLQLLGSNSEKKVQAFIKEHNLNGKAYYYKGIHKGKAWYVVICGNYANKFEAQQAIARLPYSLKKLHPWPRQYSKIHDSIKARNNNG